MHGWSASGQTAAINDIRHIGTEGCLGLEKQTAMESEKDLADFADFSKFAGAADDTEPADYSKWRFALLAWRSSGGGNGPGGAGCDV